MAIQFVGAATSTGDLSAGSWAVDLTSLTGGIDTQPAAGDVVVVFHALACSGTRAPAISTTGYATNGVFGNDTNDSQLIVGSKVMGGTPDTSVTLTANTQAGSARFAVARVYRGVDQTTPLDVANVLTSSANGTLADPGSITPVTTGAVLVIGGACAHADTAGLPDITAGYLSNSVQAKTAGSSLAGAVRVGDVAWTSGAYDGAAFACSRNTNADAWTAGVVALRPAAGSDATSTPGAGSSTGAGQAPTASGTAAVTTGVGATAGVGYAPTVSAGTDATTATGTGAASGAGQAPTVSAGATLTPGAGAASGAGQAPTVSAGLSLTLGAGAADGQGLAPSVTVSVTLTPGVGTASGTGLAPTVTGNANAAPGAGSASGAGQAPTVAGSAVSAPDVGSAGGQGHAPSVSAGGSVSLAPGAGSADGLGYEPAVAAGAASSPGVGASEGQGAAPFVSASVVLFPGAGSAEGQGHAPTVTLGTPPDPPPARIATLEAEPRTSALEAEARVAALAAEPRIAA